MPSVLPFALVPDSPPWEYILPLTLGRGFQATCDYETKPGRINPTSQTTTATQIMPSVLPFALVPHAPPWGCILALTSGRGF